MELRLEQKRQSSCLDYGSYLTNKRSKTLVVAYIRTICAISKLDSYEKEGTLSECLFSMNT